MKTEPTIVHGTAVGYSYHRCRCVPCTAAVTPVASITAARAARRQAAKDASAAVETAGAQEAA